MSTPMTNGTGEQVHSGEPLLTRLVLTHPRAVVHKIDDALMSVQPDGVLCLYEVEDDQGRDASLNLSARHAFALATFLRMPGMAAVLEAIDAQYQNERQAAYEAAAREEEILIASGFYDRIRREADDA